MTKKTINAKTWQYDEQSLFEVGGGTYVVSIYNYENGNPDDLASATGRTEEEALERARLIVEAVNRKPALESAIQRFLDAHAAACEPRQCGCGPCDEGRSAMRGGK